MVMAFVVCFNFGGWGKSVGLGISEFSDESTTWDACDGVTVGSLS